MTNAYRRHKIVGSEAHEARPMAYMRSGRHKGVLSSRGVAFALFIAIAGVMVLAATIL
jgi:hypothetical protein